MDAVVVTGKDWTKLASFGAEPWGVPVVVPSLELRLPETGAAVLREGLLNALAAGDADADSHHDEDGATGGVVSGA